jgi:hypothetical protein
MLVKNQKMTAKNVFGTSSIMFFSIWMFLPLIANWVELMRIVTVFALFSLLAFLNSFVIKRSETMFTISLIFIILSCILGYNLVQNLSETALTYNSLPYSTPFNIIQPDSRWNWFFLFSTTTFGITGINLCLSKMLDGTCTIDYLLWINIGLLILLWLFFQSFLLLGTTMTPHGGSLFRYLLTFLFANTFYIFIVGNMDANKLTETEEVSKSE